jgi:hypothetical protein
MLGEPSRHALAWSRAGVDWVVAIHGGGGERAARRAPHSACRAAHPAPCIVRRTPHGMRAGLCRLFDDVR